MVLARFGVRLISQYIYCSCATSGFNSRPHEIRHLAQSREVESIFGECHFGNRISLKSSDMGNVVHKSMKEKSYLKFVSVKRMKSSRRFHVSISSISLFGLPMLPRASPIRLIPKKKKEKSVQLMQQLPSSHGHTARMIHKDQTRMNERANEPNEQRERKKKI